MPHVAIMMYPGRSHEKKLELAVKVQNFLAGELKLDKKHVSVSIEDIAREKWNDSMGRIPENTMFIVDPDID